ncbi:glycosyltransferase [Bacteroidia bacterium]|nr:glycosyltransferase [Bacteroidia bacterium]
MKLSIITVNRNNAAGKDLILSIIVPAYNAEKYIAKCLDSLLNQDLEDYEIIVINDGSIDKTVEIVTQYTEESNIISLISQQNQGQGVARNVGISNAKGKYLMFVDADDYLKENSISLQINRIEKEDIDLLYGNYEKVDVEGHVLNKTKIEKLTNYTDKTLSSEQFLSNHFGFYCYTPLFVYKSSFIQNLDFSFLPKIYLEDTEWLSKVICYAKKIAMIDYPFYNYVQTPESSMRNQNQLEKKLKDTLFVTQLMCKFQLKNVREQGINEWFDEAISINAIMLCSAVSKKDFKSYSTMVYGALSDLNIFPLKIRKMPIKFKIMSHFINLDWNMSIFLLSIINK